MKKFKHKVTSFAEVMAIMNPNFARVAKKERRKVCHKCGSAMERVPGTNVWRCTGDKLESGKSCYNTIFDRAAGGQEVKTPPVCNGIA